MGEKSQKQALILVYTGDGKGKTSAAVGQAVRALGAGLKVAFGQFLKRDNQAGEQKILKSLLGEDFMASGKGFFRDRNQLEKHRAAALTLIQWAHEKISSNYELIVLDESIYALNMELITEKELAELLDTASAAGTHMVLTGRSIPDWLQTRADLVSEVMEMKHHFRRNISAIKGIEY